MVADFHHQHMTVEEYLELDQSSPEAKYEYIDGTSCQVFTSDVRVQLSASRYVYPDITISCESTWHYQLYQAGTPAQLHSMGISLTMPEAYAHVLMDHDPT